MPLLDSSPSLTDFIRSSEKTENHGVRIRNNRKSTTFSQGSFSLGNPVSPLTDVAKRYDIEHFPSCLTTHPATKLRGREEMTIGLFEQYAKTHSRAQLLTIRGIDNLHQKRREASRKAKEGRINNANISRITKYILNGIILSDFSKSAPHSIEQDTTFKVELAWNAVVKEFLGDSQPATADMRDAARKLSRSDFR
jgi:hypothetical protein